MLDITTYALLKKKIEQGGGSAKLPTEIVGYQQIDSIESIPTEDIYVDTLYFNTNLSDAEIVKILEPLDYLMDYSFGICFNTAGPIGIIVDHSPDTTDYSISSISDGTVLWANYEDINHDIKKGWNPNFSGKFEFKNINQLNAIGLGLTKEKANSLLPLVNLGNTTETTLHPFTKDGKLNVEVVLQPNVKVSQLRNEDGTKWKPQEDKLFEIPMESYPSKKNVYIISSGTLDLIKENPTASFKFIFDNEGATPNNFFLCNGYQAFSIDGKNIVYFFTASASVLMQGLYTLAVGQEIDNGPELVELFASGFPSGLAVDFNNPNKLVLADGDTNTAYKETIEVKTINNESIIGSGNIETVSKADLQILDQEKVDLATYATGASGLVQQDAIAILQHPDTYEGKIIQFYSNEGEPRHLISYGMIIRDTNVTHDPYLIELDRNGHTIKWTQETNYNANEGLTFKEI